MSEGRLDQRSSGALGTAGWMLAALVPGALTLYLGFRSGGFFPGATGLAAAEMAIVVVAWLALARRPFEGLSAPFALAAAALGGLAAWTLLSANWSDSMARALPEYTRALLFALVLVLFGLLPFDARRVRWMLYALAAAIIVICGAGLVARLLPDLILDPALAEKDRLGYPLTYWNSLGLVAGIGVVLCGHLSCSARDPWPARVLGATAIPLLVLTLYYTLSRGAAWGTVGAVVVYVLVGRPRALLSGAIATVPATLVVLMFANPPNALTGGDPAGATAVAAGRHMVLVLAACMLGAALLRAALVFHDRWAVSFRLPDRVRLPALTAMLVTGLVLVLAAGAALDVPGVVDAKYRQFTARAGGGPGEGSTRFLSADTNGRREHWDVALEEFRRNRLHGSGAGTYPLAWAKERSGTVHVEDAHSLYLETLGELGLVGFVLLAVALALVLGAFAYRARGPDRALFAALLAAGLGWAAAAGVDWDWEMPATTLWLFAFGGAALARSTRPVSERREWHWAWSLGARALAVLVCLVLAVTPARVAIAAGRLDRALDSFLAGECGKAKREARGSLAVVGQRVAPYEVIAFCDMQEGRYRAASAAVRRALERDPRNWELHYGLAIARASAGQDPRRHAASAAALNPQDPRAAGAPALFAGTNRRSWALAGREAELLPPSRGDP